MLTSPLFFFLLLILIFFLSRTAGKELYILFYLITRREKASVDLLTWVLIVGTVIHELAHLLTASILRVPTEGLTFTPEIRENNEVRAGGLRMAKTGPLRHFLIGIAPLIFGLTAIISLYYFLFLPLLPKIKLLSFSHPYTLLPIAYCLIISWLIFIISSTMFSSKKDMATVLFPLLLVFLLLFAFWRLGVQISFSPQLILNLEKIFQIFNSAVLATTIINLIVLFFLKLLNSLLKKIFPLQSA